MTHLIPASELSYIHPKLHAFAVSLDSVKPDPRNARLHNQRNQDEVRQSLAEHGQLIPIIVNAETGIIEKGNCTWEQTKRLGRAYIAVLYVEHDQAEASRFSLRDNRLGELGEWDHDTVTQLLNELEAEGEDISGLGWNDQELEALLASDLGSSRTGHSSLPDNNNSAPDSNLPPDDPYNGNLPPGSDASRVKPIPVTPDQWEVIEGAIERVKLLNDDNAMSSGRCLELICGDYLAGN